MFKLPELPFAMDALEPYISKNTVEYHYLKHHQGYLNKLNELISGTEFEKSNLEDIIRLSYGKEEQTELYHNAAQVWNHNLYWQSLKPDGGAPQNQKITAKIERAFGSYDDFCEILLQKALKQFGSGWVWLVKDNDEGFLIYSTSDADNPLLYRHKTLLTIDVWEHAYYLDYQNKREDYLRNVINNLLNWENVAENL